MKHLQMPVNRRINQLLFSQSWEIEKQFGLQALCNYLWELNLIETGKAELKDLSFSSRREANRPKLITRNANHNFTSLSDYQNTPANSFAHFQLSGAMRMEDGLSSPGIRTLANDIAAADHNPNIAGALIEVNSGGGESTAGTFLLSALKDFSKPVIAWGPMAASAAYRAILPADKIFASANNSSFGSIGTYVSIDKELIEYLNETVIEIYAEQSTLKNIEWREILEGKQDAIKERLREGAQLFIEDVENYRLLKDATGEATAGKLFFADRALEIGMIDGIKTYKEVVNALEALAPPRNFIHKNTQQMTFKDFLSGVVKGLNSALGTTISETAEPEAVLSSLEKITPVADQLQALRDEMTASNTGTTDQMESIATQLAEMKTTITEQANTIKALQTSRATLEKTVADMKGETFQRDETGKEGVSNGKAPDVNQFATVEGFAIGNGFVKPSQASKKK